METQGTPVPTPHRDASGFDPTAIAADVYRYHRGLPHPDWARISAHIETVFVQRDWHAAYCAVGRHWLARLAKGLGGTYRVEESPYFFVLSYRDSKELDALARFAESARTEVVGRIGAVAWISDTGKHIVLDFEDPDDFDAYRAPFLPNYSEFTAAGGALLAAGYAHVALNAGSEQWTRSVLVHELTHNLLARLPIPLWLNEGVAQTMQYALVARDEYRPSLNALLPLFHSRGLEPFWQGYGFNSRGPEVHLWYSMAHRFVALLNKADPGAFDAFLASAHHRDAGQAAAVACFHHSLGDLMARLIGPGKWDPSPQPG